MPIPLLGLGDSVRCGDLWEIGALYAPSLGDVLTNEPPKGEYARVDFMLTNLQDNTDYLDSYGTALSLVGVLEGRTLSFDATYLGTSIIDKEAGIAQWNDDIPPMVQVTAKAIFDVNPAATNWRLRLSGEDCNVEIALYDVR